MTFEEAITAITRARTFDDLVRPSAHPTSASVSSGVILGEPVETYRMLSKIVHPDVAPPTESAHATEAFAKLSSLWSASRPTGSSSAVPGSGFSDVSAGGFSGAPRGGFSGASSGRFPGAPGGGFAGGSSGGVPGGSSGGVPGGSSGGVPGGSSGGVPGGPDGAFPGGLCGDIADLTPLDGGRTLRKAPRLVGDNDLMTAEAAALRTLWTEGDPRYRAYAPRLIESVRDGRKRVNVLERLEGFVTLSDVLRLRPDGIDPRDAAWIWRRLLTALGWAHRSGVVHGAVLPPHVLIHPAEHGVVLVDWCYSVATGTPLTALVGQHRADYPPEVPSKQPATPATDIYLATVLMRRLIRQSPAPIARFLDGCLYDAPQMRPQDAWALLAELDEVLFACFGPRKFRPFTLLKGA
ncbi:hypothetical protein [Actinoplanes sp. NPDC049265]|uniref:hypothetical protein n=1 Tax=Actinoplanes sp. NPDC049265 TaxID=3363902 RepID=UPI00371332EE